MSPYSLDLRRRIVDAYVNGEGSIREIAERFSVAPNTVQNYLTQVRATGSLAPLPHGGGVGPKIDRAGLDEVRKLVEEKNDRTLAELAEQFEQRQEVRVSIPTMHRALQRLGITRKKNASSERAVSARRPQAPRSVPAASTKSRRTPHHLLRRVRSASRDGAAVRSCASRASGARQGAV
ncbi:IS630 transposase-related protein [Sorangium sp. So ce426]